MPSSSSVAEARRALGQRLREIRKDAGLIARALAGLAGWHESKCSRIEHGGTPPSDADIRAWTRHCNAEDQTADLIATARAVKGIYVEWRRMERAGLKQVQESVAPLFERTRRFRATSPGLCPACSRPPPAPRPYSAPSPPFADVPDDIDAAVAIRMERQRILHSGDHRFAMLVEE